MQVDRSHRQHLYEIYCLQIQMVERLRGRREGGVATVQVNCALVSGSIFMVSLSAFVNAHTHTHTLTQGEIVGTWLLTVEVCLS